MPKKMPAFKLRRVLVYFAAFKNHVGFYPTPKAIEAFKERLSVYNTSKGAIQFPLDREIPLDLIAQITKFRVEQESERLKKEKNEKIDPFN